MVDLIAKSACDGLLPITVGKQTLSEEEVGVMTSVAPFKRKAIAVSKLLKEAHDLTLPQPNRSAGKAGQRIVWFTHNQYMLMGPEADPGLASLAALTDQSDAWSVVKLEGPGAEDVLARLVPVDLRAGTFKRGHTVRSDLMHMTASITRIGPQSFMIMVFRSMAKTLVHDLKTAMEGVAARG